MVIYGRFLPNLGPTEGQTQSQSHGRKHMLLYMPCGGERRLAIDLSKNILILFVQSSRALFSTQGSSSTAEFFKPSRAQGARLRHYSIDCRIPCVQVVLCLSADAATIMNKQLLTLQRPGRKSKTGNSIPFFLSASPELPLGAARAFYPRYSLG